MSAFEGEFWRRMSCAWHCVWRGTWLTLLQHFDANRIQSKPIHHPSEGLKCEAFPRWPKEGQKSLSEPRNSFGCPCSEFLCFRTSPAILRPSSRKKTPCRTLGYFRWINGHCPRPKCGTLRTRSRVGLWAGADSLPLRDLLL